MKKQENTGTLQLVSPWVDYYRKVQALFKEDPQVNVVFDQQHAELKIYIDDSDKADALATLLPTEKTFGNVTMKISIIPGNSKFKIAMKNPDEIFRCLFYNNPAVVEIRTLKDPSLSNAMTFVVFKADVVQYYADNIASLNGLVSCLYENLANDLFEKTSSVFFSTEKIR